MKFNQTQNQNTAKYGSKILTNQEVPIIIKIDHETGVFTPYSG